MKTCSTCGKNKPLEAFNKTGNNGTRAQCKVCQALKIKEIRIKRKQEVAKYVAALRAEGCCICGEKRPYCLDFHHIDPDEKEYAPAALIKGLHSLERVKKELDKCIVVCSNCHREIHYLG